MLALTALPVLGLAQTAAAARSVHVSIAYRAYQPSLLDVEVGDTVTWTNVGLGPHTVTADAGQFDSGRLNAGESFSVAFTTLGTFLYSCTVHPTMHGRVIVGLPGSVSSAPPPGPASSSVQISLSLGSGPRGRLTLVHVQAPRPGARVLLELYSSAAAGWQTLRQARLSRQGKATLSVSATIHRRLRAVVLGPPGRRPLVSRSVRHPA